MFPDSNAKKQFGISKADSSYIDEQVQERKVKFVPIGERSPGGLKLGLCSLHKFGKTTNAMLLGYMNLEFKDKLLAAGLNGVVKLLQKGVLPEVEKIWIVDTECDVVDNISRGTMGALCAPLLDRISVAETPIKRKQEGLDKNGKPINVDAFDVDHQRENIIAAIKTAVDQLDESGLLVFDSASDFKKNLDDLQEIMFGRTIIANMKPSGGVEEPVSNNAFFRSFYQYRNKWWQNVLMLVKSSRSWAVSTIKMEEVDDEYRTVIDPVTRKVKTDSNGIPILKPPMYMQVCKNTGYRIDQCYLFRKVVSVTGEVSQKLRVEWAKHRHSVPSFREIGEDWNAESKCMLDYRMFDRLAMCHIIEDMAPSLLGEGGEMTW